MMITTMAAIGAGGVEIAGIEFDQEPRPRLRRSVRRSSVVVSVANRDRIPVKDPRQGRPDQLPCV